MNRQEVVNFLDSSNEEEKADFNDNSDYKVFSKDGSGTTDGVSAANSFNNLDENDKQWVEDHLNSTLGIKDPC